MSIFNPDQMCLTQTPEPGPLVLYGIADKG